MRIPITLFALLLLVLPVGADMIYVPFDQPTIQQGINAAVAGDVVVVSDGTYTGPGNVNLDFKGKAIAVRSSNGPLQCIIDMENAARGVLFIHSEGTDSVFEGFTLRNGQAPRGGGIMIADSSPTISRNIIEQCTATSIGGGIYVRAASSAVITGNLIQQNQAASGGGIALLNCLPVVTSNRFLDNSATGDGGGLHSNMSAPELVNNLFFQNHAGTNGGAIHVITPHYSGAYITLASATLDHNTAAGKGSGLYCRNCRVDVINSIFTANEDKNIQVGDETAAAFVHVEYSMVQGGAESVVRHPGSVLTTGDGVFNSAPRYAQGPLGIHYLQSNSDCVNAGSDDVANICFTGAGGPVCMDELTTRVSGLLDYSTVDLGYHFPPNTLSIRTLWVKGAITPPAGLLPFNGRFWILLRQATIPETPRLAAVNIGLRTSGGQYFRNWRSGTAFVTQGEDTLEVWTQVIPNLWSFAGENQFLVRVEDISPPPYNLPPYQPSGGTAINTFIFTGVEP